MSVAPSGPAPEASAPRWAAAFAVVGAVAVFLGAPPALLATLPLPVLFAARQSRPAYLVAGVVASLAAILVLHTRGLGTLELGLAVGLVTVAVLALAERVWRTNADYSDLPQGGAPSNFTPSLEAPRPAAPTEDGEPIPAPSGSPPTAPSLTVQAASFGSTPDQIVEACPDLILVLDAGGRILYASPSTLLRLGLESAELTTRWLADYVHPNDLVRLRNGLREMLRRASSWKQTLFRFRHRDGSWLYLDALGCCRQAPGYAREILLFAREVTERLELESQLKRQAFQDPLTGLANRALLINRLEHSLAELGRGPGSIAVIFVDLDRFKNVNDALGHPAGDELLQVVA
ncbi:MAG: diguanylate cyclase, partial [Armatimonadetes bacterium]|nr:diguanylate cyclase [Armatimonadota bacterium]